MDTGIVTFFENEFGEKIQGRAVVRASMEGFELRVTSILDGEMSALVWRQTFETEAEAEQNARVQLDILERRQRKAWL